MDSSIFTSEKKVQNLQFSNRLLANAGRFWFVVATAGQLCFGIYIFAFYHASAISGDFARWSQVLPKGIVEGDWKGNLQIGMHVLLAGFMVVAGPLQFIPAIRNRYRSFHRKLGRAYVYLAVFISFGGFIMLMTRSTIGSLDMRIFNSFQAFYVFVFAYFAVKYAKQKNFAEHQKYALRLFLVANGVWFFRVGLMAWLLIHKAPVGFDPDTFSGPFLSALSVFTYALPIPLLVSELYFRAKKSTNQRFVLAISVTLILLTLLMAVGIFGAVIGMWLPRI